VKPIEANNQVKLGPGRCVQLALTGMSYRMFRSLITIAILALAVAFLVHMLAYGLVGNATQRAAFDELSADRAAGEAVTRLTSADSVKAILAAMVDGDDTGRLGEYRAWSGVPSADFDAALAAAEDAAAFADYLDRLPPATHAALVGDDTPMVLLDRLGDAAQLDRFQKTATDMSLAPPLGDWSAMRGLALRRWPRAAAVARDARAGHRAAIGQVRGQFAGRSPGELFGDAPDGLAQALSRAGFAITADELPAVAAFVARTRDKDAVTAMLADDDVRKAMARRERIEKKQVNSDLVLNYLDSAGNARWFAQVLAENGAPAALTADRLEELGAHHRRQAKLEAAAGAGPPEAGAFMGLGASTLYLIALSFIVCIVGVANAMLMSVTERFTEIATMKCLGAMDRFVMMMFVFEAAIQGVVGGVVGLLLGVVLALGRGLLEFGVLLGAAASSAGDIAVAAALSLVVGVVLATLAAVGPSWVAARLAPMEAMRVE